MIGRAMNHNHFARALKQLTAAQIPEAIELTRHLRGAQCELFFHRVRHSKIRTPFIDKVLATALALRMEG